MKAYLYREVDKLDSALLAAHFALSIARRNNYFLEQEINLNALGMTYTLLASYDKSLICLFESLELREKRNDKAVISICLNNIGLVYYKIKDYKRAAEYFSKAIDFKREINNSYGLDRALINLSLCYAYQNQFSEAERFLNEAFTICDSSCSDQILTEGKFCKGVIAFGLKNFNKSEELFKESYQFAVNNNNERFEFENIIFLLKIELINNNLISAHRYINAAEEILSEADYNLAKIQTYEQIFKVYLRQRDYEKATKFMGMYISLRNRIYNEDLTQNLMVTQAEYEQRENKEILESGAKILVLKADVINSKRLVSIYTGIAVALLIALVMILYMNGRRKEKANLLLEKRVVERTKSLQLNYELIMQSFQKQNHNMNKVKSDINSLLSTVRGLGAVASSETVLQDRVSLGSLFQSSTERLSSIINSVDFESV
jgi:tetratricopeptide (TPR) repeat protein